VQAVNEGNLTPEEVGRALDEQLTREEREYAVVELSKDVDLHRTLTSLNETLVQREVVWRELARAMFSRIVDGHGQGAMAGRAVMSVVGDVAEGAYIGFQHYHRGSCVSNTVLGLLLSSIEVYKWSRGSITATELLCNVGEHVAGCSAAYGGSVAGATVCFPFGPTAVVLGALVGGFVADWLARNLFRAGIAAYSGKREETEHEAKQRALNTAAERLGIDLQRDGFAFAKSKFRRMVLDSHPDRHSQHGNDDSQQAAQIIADWNIVRGYYDELNQLGDGGGNKEPEVVVQLWQMKRRKSVDDAWQVVRTWFGEMSNAPTHIGHLEMVEMTCLYL
jgi:hypothetical protein